MIMEMENKTTKLRIVKEVTTKEKRLQKKRGYKKNPQSFSSRIRIIIPVLQGSKVTSGQINPLFYPLGGKVDISARWLLCLPAKLD